MFYETLADRCNRLIKIAIVYVVCRRNRAPMIATLSSGDRAILDDGRLGTVEIEKILAGLAKSDRLVAVAVHVTGPAKIDEVYWNGCDPVIESGKQSPPGGVPLNFYNHQDILDAATNCLMEFVPMDRYELVDRLTACLPEGQSFPPEVYQSISRELREAGL